MGHACFGCRFTKYHSVWAINFLFLYSNLISHWHHRHTMCPNTHTYTIYIVSVFINSHLLRLIFWSERVKKEKWLRIEFPWNHLSISNQNTHCIFSNKHDWWILKCTICKASVEIQQWQHAEFNQAHLVFNQSYLIEYRGFCVCAFLCTYWAERMRVASANANLKHEGTHAKARKKNNYVKRFSRIVLKVNVS